VNLCDVGSRCWPLPSRISSQALKSAPHRNQAKSSAAPHLLHLEHRLDNGLRVMIHPDRRVPRVAVNLLYRAGSRDDPAGRAGLAHLLEHMMFMGTEHVPKGRFDLLMEQVGGWSNAFTSEDITVYYEVGPARLLETLLWLEADRMVGVAAALTAAKLRLQRDVVLNELWQEYHNTPYAQVELVQPGLLHPPSHPYARPVIGNEAELRAITLADLQRHLGRFYSPANASLVLAGDLDPRAAMELVRRHFDWIPSSPPPLRVTRRWTPTLRRERRRRLLDAVELPRLILTWHSPAHFAAGDAEMDLAADVLAAGKDSRLHRTLVHRHRLALKVEAYQLSRPLGSLFTVSVTARRGVNLERLERMTLELLAAFARRPVAERELTRARQEFETDLLLGLQQVGRRAELLNIYAESIGSGDGVLADLERYRRVTRESMREVALAVLGRPRATVWVQPRDGAPPARTRHGSR